MGGGTSGSAVASFPRWSWLKGPVRKVRYEVINNCPIFNYTERELRFLFGGGGFSRGLIKQGRGGFLVRADSHLAFTRPEEGSRRPPWLRRAPRPPPLARAAARMQAAEPDP